MKVLLPAGQIPDGTVVTKRTGTKPYTLKESVKVYGEPSQRQEIKGDGVRFLVSADGGINAVSETVELLAELDDDEIQELLGK